MSLFLSVIALISSVFSPIAVALLKNRHDKTMFEKEFYEKRKCEVIENYLKCVGAIIFYNEKSKSETAEWISEIYMYAPEEMWDEIDKMNQLVINNAIHYGENSYTKEVINYKYIDFCKKFSKFSREQIVKPKQKGLSLLRKLRRSK